MLKSNLGPLKGILVSVLVLAATGANASDFWNCVAEYNSQQMSYWHNVSVEGTGDAITSVTQHGNSLIHQGHGCFGERTFVLDTSSLGLSQRTEYDFAIESDGLLHIYETIDYADGNGSGGQCRDGDGPVICQPKPSPSQIIASSSLNLNIASKLIFQPDSDQFGNFEEDFQSGLPLKSHKDIKPGLGYCSFYREQYNVNPASLSSPFAVSKIDEVGGIVTIGLIDPTSTVDDLKVSCAGPVSMNRLHTFPEIQHMLSLYAKANLVGAGWPGIINYPVIGIQKFLNGKLQFEVTPTGRVEVLDTTQGNKSLYQLQLPVQGLKMPFVQVKLHDWKDIYSNDPRGIHFVTFSLIDSSKQEHRYSLYGSYRSTGGQWMVTGEKLPFTSIIAMGFWTANGSYVRDWTFTPQVDLGSDLELVQFNGVFAVIDSAQMKILFSSGYGDVSCGNAPHWDFEGRGGPARFTVSDMNSSYDFKGNRTSSCEIGKVIDVDLQHGQFVTVDSWNHSYPP